MTLQSGSVTSGQNTQQRSHSQVTQVDILEHIISRITKSRLTIYGCWVRIRSNGRAPLDAFETLVITLGGGEDGPQRITQRIERDDVRGRESRHSIVCVRERGVGVGKGLTAG